MHVLLISVYCSITINKVFYRHREEWRPILMHIYFILIQILKEIRSIRGCLLLCTYSPNFSIALAIVLQLDAPSPFSRNSSKAGRINVQKPLAYSAAKDTSKWRTQPFECNTCWPRHNLGKQILSLNYFIRIYNLFKKLRKTYRKCIFFIQLYWNYCEQKKKKLNFQVNNFWTEDIYLICSTLAPYQHYLCINKPSTECPEFLNFLCFNGIWYSLSVSVREKDTKWRLCSADKQ